MKYYLVAGEASGDLHASNLVKAIRSLDSKATFRGIGGDKMKEAGVELLLHYKDISFMGFLEVVQNLSVIRRALKACEQDIALHQPDVFIPVDYPGFNLRMVKHAKRLGLKTCYYISPKLWAWRSSRVEIIKRFVDKVLLIFPFEESFYKKHNYRNAIYVGNPLLDELKDFQPTHDFRLRNDLTERTIVALLPGSRKQEIAQCLPSMLASTKSFTDVQFVIAGMKHTRSFIESHALPANVKVVYDQTYDLLGHSTAAVVTSGTATLETALLNVPQVCAYRTSSLTYNIAKRVVKVPFISLVNLVANKKVIEELIQHDMTPQNISNTLKNLLPGGAKRAQMLTDYQTVRDALQTEGASLKAAQVIVEMLSH